MGIICLFINRIPLYFSRFSKKISPGRRDDPVGIKNNICKENISLTPAKMGKLFIKQFLENYFFVFNCFFDFIYCKIVLFLSYSFSVIIVTNSFYVEFTFNKMFSCFTIFSIILCSHERF